MNLTNNKIYKALKRNQTIYFLKVRLLNKDYKSNLRKINSSPKSKEQIKREMSMLKEYWNCQPLHYIRYALFNKNLSDDELKDFIPPYYFYNCYFESLYKNIDQDKYDNKLSLFRIFQERGIPTPKVIAIFDKGLLKDIDGNELSPNNLIKRHSGNLFFKPVNGMGGTGIEVFQNGNINDFISKLNINCTYIVQKAIIQREDIKQINSSSVNTLRVITQIRNGQAKICACVMRIGRNGKLVDNSHQGGLSIQINTEDGSFYPIATAEHGGGEITAHPDSGFVFKNQKISNWDDIKISILNCAAKFPELKDIAWDVAIVPNGIEMIELNLGYGIDHLQCSCGGMRRKLNIYPNIEIV